MAAEGGITFKRLITMAFVIFLVDLPWLSIITGPYNAAIKLIQGGGEVRMRPLAALAVYPALAYLALQTTTMRQAFYTGMAVYAVYDFTVMEFYLRLSFTFVSVSSFKSVYTLE